MSAAQEIAALRPVREAEISYQQAAAIAEKKREIRNQAVRTAAANGATQSMIAAATGLTRGRIGQIMAR